MSQIRNTRPVAASNSAVHVVWQDYRDGNAEIYYKRNPTGNTVGIKELPSAGMPVAIFPNPASTEIKIQSLENIKELTLPKLNSLNIFLACKHTIDISKLTNLKYLAIERAQNIDLTYNICQNLESLMINDEKTYKFPSFQLPKLKKLVLSILTPAEVTKRFGLYCLIKAIMDVMSATALIPST